MTLALEDVINATCPWSGQPVAADALTLYRGAVVGFCNPGCRDKFEAAISMFDNCCAARPGHSATPGQGEDVSMAEKA